MISLFQTATASTFSIAAVSAPTDENEKKKLPPDNMWELRRKSDIDFPAIPEGPGPKFFQDGGKVKPENVNAIGHVSRLVDEQNRESNINASADVGSIFSGPTADGSASSEAHGDKKVLDTEEDAVKAAREGRMTAFASIAEKYGVSLTPELLACDIAKYAAPDDEVVCVLKIANITGMPATTQNITVHGSIEAALVRSRGDKSYPRLFFSVAQGTAQLNVHEKFSFWQNDFTRATDLSGEYNPCGICACCFPCLTVSAGASSTYNSVNSKGSFFFDYTISRDITNQFSYLPLENTLIDAMTYNESRAHFTAKAADENKSASSDTKISTYEKGPCSWCKNCCKCDCNCSCYACLTCTCIKCPPCPSCCSCCKRVGGAKIGISTNSKTVDYADTFNAHEDHVVGKEPELNGFAAGGDQGVDWSVTKSLTNEVFVVLQYRSVHDNRQHTCKMQVQYSKTAYADARTFVAAIGSHRYPMFTHPAHDVAPVGSFGKGVPQTATAPGIGIGMGIGMSGMLGGVAAGGFNLADIAALSSSASSTTAEGGACYRLWYMANYYSCLCCYMKSCVGLPEPGATSVGAGTRFKLWYMSAYYFWGCSLYGKYCGIPKPKGICC